MGVKVKNLNRAPGVIVLLLLQAGSAFAQCAMCKAGVQGAASANPQAVADTLNLAVLVLLIPPVLIFSALFLALMRYRRGADERPASKLKAAGALD